MIYLSLFLIYRERLLQHRYSRNDKEMCVNLEVFELADRVVKREFNSNLYYYLNIVFNIASGDRTV